MPLPPISSTTPPVSKFMIEVHPGRTAVQSGTAVQRALTKAQGLKPYGNALSAQNRVIVKPYPGMHDFAGTPLNPNVNFVDIVGGAAPRDVVFTSNAKTVVVDCAITDHLLQNLFITTRDASTIAGGGDNTTTAAFWNCNNSLSTSIRYYDLLFGGAGVNNGVRGGTNFYGQALRCGFTNGGFFGHSRGNFGGWAHDCWLEDPALTGYTTNSLQTVTGGIITMLRLWAQLHLYSHAGIIEGGFARAQVANTDAMVFAGVHAASGGAIYGQTLVATGSGKSINAADTFTMAVGHCRGNTNPIVTNFTNAILGPDGNVWDAAII